MKKFSLILLLLSQVSFAKVEATTTVNLMQNFTSILNQTMIESDGDVRGLFCVLNRKADGIICNANIILVDVASGSQGGGEEYCNEVYTYNGKDTLNTLCSSCEYSKSYGTYQSSCLISSFR